MPRPKTKKELLALSNENYKKLIAFINGLPKEKRNTEFPSQFLNRNIRDVLAHLHHWHILVLSWYNQGKEGKKPEMPAPGYTWRTVPELNIEINRNYKNIPIEEVFTRLEASFKEIRQLIANHTEKELFEKQRYSWTGTTSLASYLISATSSHYEWALKLIKKGIK
ncbi:ClbS/DfsB family four-helix bundle protein [Maribacter sp. 2210JD10-5]|uniref:ClbS/DfsB family four-helix bundle protein n=1 Tax=Maribacter sp. 2210JD10-5 TaxID=3386272 RepID=UPI0039BD7362